MSKDTEADDAYNPEFHLPEFTAKLLTELVFAYHRWTGYTQEHEESPLLKTIHDENTELRTYILAAILFAGQSGPGKRAHADNFWPKVMKDKALATFCLHVIMQYASEMASIQAAIKASRGKPTDLDKIFPDMESKEGQRLMTDQLLITTFMLVRDRKIDILKLSEEEVEDLFHDLATTLKSGFQEGLEHQDILAAARRTAAKTEAIINKRKNKENWNIKEPGYIHKEGNA